MVQKHLEEVCEPEEETGQYRFGVFLFGRVAYRQSPLHCFWREFQLLHIMTQGKSYCHWGNIGILPFFARLLSYFHCMQICQKGNQDWGARRGLNAWQRRFWEAPVNWIILEMHGPITLLNSRQFCEAMCCTNHTAVMCRNRSKPACSSFAV